ncbi:MAG TPA: pyrimidine 5'-nucleotidase [Mariprofundaceae bacterium]|nr:pyrimidine 5'-nucleotidase [Mariprofundaceae bacterium]
MPFDLAVIDLDNTLYAADNGVFARMDQRMTAFVSRQLGVGDKEANTLRIRYWREYGTTLRGLMLHHGMEAEPFLHDVHDIDVETILEPDTTLDAALHAMPGRKVIHTNGIREHAERVLASLAIGHHFDAIYDIRFNNYTPKPCSDTLAMLLAREQVTPDRALVIDDMADNLAAARKLGTRTAWISQRQETSGEWHFQAASVTDLAAQLTPLPT